MDKRPSLQDFIAELDEFELVDNASTFDRMMFDVCGEVNHVRAASGESAGKVEEALRGLNRSCKRVYSSNNVTMQRKYTLRTAEWILKSWCVWGANDISSESATRWFDAWQRERNMALLEL